MLRGGGLRRTIESPAHPIELTGPNQAHQSVAGDSQHIKILSAYNRLSLRELQDALHGGFHSLPDERPGTLV